MIKIKFRMGNYNKRKIPILLLGKGEFIVMGGLYNGNIIIQKLNKDNNSFDIEILDNSTYPINNIIIDKKENYSICSNLKGSIFIYQINKNEKNKWNIYKEINDCYSEILSMNLNEKLNIFVTYSNNNLCMIYTFPKFKLVNSFKLYDEFNEEIQANKFLISFSPLSSYLFYSERKKQFYVYSINGEKILEKKTDYLNDIKIFTNSYSQDFVYFYEIENKNIKIYSMPYLDEIHSFNLKCDCDIFDMDISDDKSFIIILNKENNEKKFNIKLFKYRKTKM